jgi:AraC-like DNA-binding protein
MRFYSTDSVGEKQRTAYWSSLASEAITPMKADAGRSSRAFFGRMWAHNVGRIAFVRAFSTSVVLRRTPADIARMQERRFLITMSEDARFVERGNGYEAELRPNDLLFSDLTEPNITLHSGCTALTVLIPEADFKRHLPGADDLNGLIVRGDRGAGRIAASMIRALAPNNEQHFNDHAAEHVATALLHAIAAAYAETYGERIQADAATGSRRLQMVQFVEEHLDEAELNVARVATAFGVTDRYVRMLFEGSQEPLSAYIRRRRFEECARQLCDPLLRSRTISEIALSCGFNSLASFDRAFKAYFDMTPREYRVSCDRPVERPPVVSGVADGQGRGARKRSS